MEPFAEHHIRCGCGNDMTFQFTDIGDHIRTNVRHCNHHVATFHIGRDFIYQDATYATAITGSIEAGLLRNDLNDCAVIWRETYRVLMKL